jgi:hypothetical protein
MPLIADRALRFLLVLSIGLAISWEQPASADPAVCHKTIAKQLQRFKKKQVRSLSKCLDKENAGKIAGPCPDPTTQIKLDSIADSVTEKIAASCSMADLSALGFASNCELAPASGGVEADCFALPVTNTTEFAECLQCWKLAELKEYVAVLYASHALEVCGGDLGETSPECSNLEFSTPLPDQRNLKGGEYDCQLGIGKGGFKYLILREKALENCALAGGTEADCLADPEVQLKLAKAIERKDVLIDKKCGNRDPVASPPFCCRTGPMQMCAAAASRDDCEDNLLGTVQEDKVCGGGNTCENPPGNQKFITWWEACPEAGAALSNLDDLKTCVATSADHIISELMCWQFPGGGGTDWPCPPEGSPSGAFLDGVSFY